MAKSYEATQSDRDIARIGIEMQAKQHGLDIDDPKVRSFIEHMIEVDATNHAAIRFYCNALHPKG